MPVCRSQSGLFIVAIAVAIMSVAGAQIQIGSFSGNSSVESFARGVAVLGDIDADGVVDYAIGAPDSPVGIVFYAGTVRAYSGATGAVLWVVNGVSSYEGMGRSIDTIDDLDGDGIDELAIGATGTISGGFPVGSAMVVSGATGATILQFVGTAPNDRFGSAVAAAGDVDADGIPDIIVGATQYTPPNPFSTLPSPPGYAVVFSGRNGGLLMTMNGVANDDSFGFAVACAGDVDGDGRSDVIVGARQVVQPFPGSPNSFANGYVHVFSGASGALLYSISANSAGDDFGFDVGTVGDADHDGYDDFFASAPNDDVMATNDGALTIYSGATGLAIRTFNGKAQDDLLGRAAVGVGDVNGDGEVDIAITSPLHDSAANNAGEVSIYTVTTGAVLQTIDGMATDEIFGLSINAAPKHRAFIVGAIGPPFTPGLARAYDLGPSLVPSCALGTIGLNAGGPYSVLHVNGSDGGVTHRVDISLFSPITVSVSQPPTYPFPARFLIWGHVGVPQPGITFASTVGTLCFPPSHLNPTNPFLFCLTNSYGPDPSQLVGSTLAPWSYTYTLGLSFAANFAIQGMIDANTNVTNLVRLTNAVLIDIR